MWEHYRRIGMLQVAGYLNMLIAVLHIIGLLWADTMFRVTGIGREMEQLSAVHGSLPYVLTVGVAIVFFVFGLYALSAAGKWRALPLLKPAIFTIAGIYLLRGVGELLADSITNTNSASETLYSLIAIAIGLLFLIGGKQRFAHKQKSFS